MSMDITSFYSGEKRDSHKAMRLIYIEAFLFYYKYKLKSIEDTQVT